MKKRYIFLISVILIFAAGSNLSAQISHVNTQTSTTTTSTLTITKPSGLVVGDFMLMQVVQSGNGNTISDAAPTGWTVIAGSDIRSTFNSRCRATLLYKVATTTDVEAVSFSVTLDTDTDGGEGAVSAFRGVYTTSPFSVTPGTAYTNIATDNALNATAISPAFANSAIVMFGAYYDNLTASGWTTTSPGALTEIYDVPFDAVMDIGMGAAWALKAATGTTGGGSATLTATAYNGSILIALRPQPVTYSLNVSVAGSGSVTLNPSGGTYESGTAVTLTPVRTVNNLSFASDFRPLA